MSLQLEKREFAFQGESYELVCNMAALEDLEGAYDGSMKAAMEDTADHVTAKLMLCMLNRARKKRGQEPVSREEFAEEVNYAMLRELDVFGMFVRALSPTAPKPEAKNEEPGN